MVKILIIDDDPIKRGNIIKALRSIPELRTEDISVASDLIEARNILSRRFFDLVVLDIFLPPLPDAKPTPDAGIQFVHELRLSTTLIKPAHVIGLTAFEDGLDSADQAFFDELWRVIKYDATGTAWSKQLCSKVLYLLQCKKEILSGQNSTYDFDLAIITALWSPEMKAVLDLPVTWDKRTIANDGTEYFVGKQKEGSQSLQVVAASCSQMGIASAAVLSLKIINHFRPRYLAMCGIAAGIRSTGLSYGDILVVEQSWDYESGKRRGRNGGESVLIPDPHFIPITADLRDRFAGCIGKSKYLEDIQRHWSGKRPDGALKAALGPVASGAAVVEDSNVVTDVAKHARKLIGIEMETYGVFYAAQNCCKPRPQAFAMKSVVDFADDTKNDAFQEYAAFTSAQYLWRFAVDHIVQ